MKYGNELKVGLAILAAIAIFFFGIRYFQDLPLFGGTYELSTRLERAAGVSEGSTVDINGVRVGNVTDVRLDPQTKEVDVRFRVNQDVEIPQGSEVRVSGVSAIGDVRLSIEPGPAENPPVEPGSTLPAQSAGDLLGRLSQQGPQLINRADSVLLAAETILGETNALLQNPQSNLNQTLVALRQSSETLNRLLQNQDEHLTRTLENTAALTDDLRQFTDENADTLGASLNQFNRVLNRLDQNLAALEETTTQLNAVTTRIESGEGTLGRLINDPSLYVQLDSSVSELNNILIDVRSNPRRYLRELTLIDLF